MDDLNENALPGPKLVITFPKSNEDHRLQLVNINGVIFAIVHSPLESSGPIHMYCEEWNLVLLAPVKSHTHIVVSALNVICLSEIISAEGNVNIHASQRLVKFGDLFKPPEKVCEMGERGEFQLNDDPGFYLYYYRLFEGLATSVRQKSPEAFAAAQQQFIAGLCTLADKLEGGTENLNLAKVLSWWNIPQLP